MGVHQPVPQTYNEDTTPLTTKELWGHLGYAFASDVYSVSAIVIAVPILLESLATTVAVDALDPTKKCDTSVEGYRCSLNVFGTMLDTTSWSFLVISVSVLLQALVYVFCGALADHGSWRKHFLLFFALIGGISSILFLFVTPTTYWLAAALTIISNVSYGASYVFFLAYIPVLTRVHPDYLTAKNESKGSLTQSVRKAEETVANKISTHANGAGFLSGIIMLCVTAGLVYVMKGNENFALQIGIALCGAWWLLFSLLPMKWLRTRPGPPLPAGESYALYSWKRLLKTILQLKRLPTLFLYLLTWFILSDGFHTISHVSILFAKRYLQATQSELLILSIVVPFCALTGCYFFLWVQTKLEWSTKKMVMLLSAIYVVLPVYGILGFLPPDIVTIGLRHKWELYVVASLHGLLLGALGSFCRVLFAELTPRGHESEFFAFFEITDKGSAWVGPAVVALITSRYDMRWTFVFLFFTMFVPVLMLLLVDDEKGKVEAERFVVGDGTTARLEFLEMLDKT